MSVSFHQSPKGVSDRDGELGRKIGLVDIASRSGWFSEDGVIGSDVVEGVDGVDDDDSDEDTVMWWLGTESGPMLGAKSLMLPRSRCKGEIGKESEGAIGSSKDRKKASRSNSGSIDVSIDPASWNSVYESEMSI